MSLESRLKEAYPEVYEEIKALLEGLDISCIPDIERYFVETHGAIEGKNKGLFILIVVILVDRPLYLGVSVMKRGVRNELARVAGLIPTAVSHQYKSTKDYYDVNKRFREEVNTLADSIKQRIINNG